ncbi:MAG: hypothetical protein HOL98_13690 [Gammaproteobacteria bacterium]|nr:hypothetical protein [Gammaproteobacteria bacterium]MBT5204504.1 hypothetical protein [Gammaproteobacteria bacterium]MBT5601271.1 hypothetical protein [Gammaproteobacteria bacterium]MBT6244946.1 hypothetical protein [Gammaproteobacteria bacterium]
MPNYENLFQPLEVGPCVLKNRIVRSPHGIGLFGEGLIAYHEARARGGVAMSTIQATGTMPRADGMQLSMPGLALPGFDRLHVYSSRDLLGFGKRVELNGPAVVFDDTGSFEAISACDLLLAQGLKVTLISRHNIIGESLPYPPVTVGAARECLYEGDFDFIGGHYLQHINAEEVQISVLFTSRKRSIAAQTVVFVGYNEPNRLLWRSLQGNGPKVHMIGDVRGRNSIMSAIHAGAELGRSI